MFVNKHTGAVTGILGMEAIGNISPTVGNNLIWQGWYLADNI